MRKTFLRILYLISRFSKLYLLRRHPLIIKSDYATVYEYVPLTPSLLIRRKRTRRITNAPIRTKTGKFSPFYNFLRAEHNLAATHSLSLLSNPSHPHSSNWTRTREPLTSDISFVLFQETWRKTDVHALISLKGLKPLSSTVASAAILAERKDFRF